VFRTRSERIQTDLGIPFVTLPLFISVCFHRVSPEWPDPHHPGRWITGFNWCSCRCSFSSLVTGIQAV